MDAPVIGVVEAKNKRIAAGYGQYVAEMVAAQRYNQRDGKELPNIYGVVTTGHAWKFLCLTDSMIYIDREDYYINNPEKIIGVLDFMLGS